ncbi:MULTISPECIES: hypothetical protein [unclassified Endozoicomonas]|uniref:hypothetical protein n=3 Tax=Endozoicomonas TaxID=305899 RepID=UPI0021478D4A|nr:MULTISPECIES: hypothetical protein [unclassified Endozoicomonas]
MRILGSVYHGLSGLARTVKDEVLARFRGKKTEVVEHPVRKMTEKSSHASDTRPLANKSPAASENPVASKGYLLAKKLTDQSLPAHKVSSVELPPRFPYIDIPEENQSASEPPSRTRKILTALMPGSSPVPENSDISLKKTKRWQTRRLRKGLQTIKRETGLEVSIRSFDDQAAVLRDFLTGKRATLGYHEIKVFCDDVKSVMTNAGSLPGLIKLAVTKYMIVLSDLGQAAQLKSLGQRRQQLAERFLPGHDGFRAHCLRRNIDPDLPLNLHDIRRFQEKLMGWQDELGHWHRGLIESPELSSMEALKDRLKVELESFIDKMESAAPEAAQAPASLSHEQLQAEITRLYDQHGIKDLPGRQQNAMEQSVAEQHPVLQSATQYQVQPSGNLQNHTVTSLEKARLHRWVFEQQLADLRVRNDRLDHDLEAVEQELRRVTEQRQDTSKAIQDIQARKQKLQRRKAKIPHSPLPTVILRDSKGAQIDSDFMKKPELDERSINLHVVRCQPEVYRQINNALLNTTAFENDKALNQFKDTMRSFRNQCYQYAIGAKLPSKILSENDTQLITNSRQRINSAMETLLANPETADTTTAFHFLRMQEAILDNFLKMNGMSGVS